MTASELAREAVNQARQYAPFLSVHIVEEIARARLALAVNHMDDSIPAAVRLMRLDDGFSVIHELLFPVNA
jgi:uncharacterized protein GlcG (DUF336 family)